MYRFNAMGDGTDGCDRLHAGKTAGKDGKTFPDWDPKVYGMSLKDFSRFVWAVRK
jgi:hypothetical protein